MRRITLVAISSLGVFALTGCPNDPCTDNDEDTVCVTDGGDDDLAETLFVGHEGSLASYDLTQTNAPERAGSVVDFIQPVEISALHDGTIMVNLSGSDQILAVDSKTMLEKARIDASATNGERPVHGFVTPERNNKQYWLALNDGRNNVGNTARFVDIKEGSAGYLTAVGEVALGVGHHKAALSNTLERAVISNISDCNNVLSVYDYSNIGSITTLATLTAAQAGWTAADPGTGNFNPRFCDPTYSKGTPPAPHGCATSKVSGKTYCNLTSSGEMVVVTTDASPPTFTIVPTAGQGGGFTFAHPAGRYIYTMQEEPREGAGGAACQIGQVAVTDASTDTVVAQVPLFYKGPSCTEPLETVAATANPGHAHFTGTGGNRLFIPTSGGFGAASARVNQVLVMDTTNPAAPVQQASIQVGQHTSHSNSALSGAGDKLFVVHTIDGTVSEINTATATVTRTITVKANPKVVATFGTAEGPSEQTGPIH